MTGDSTELLLLVNLTVMVVIAVVGFMYAVREMRMIHGMLNSRMTELIELTRQVAHSAGMKEERESVR